MTSPPPPATQQTWVHDFEDGGKERKDLLGGKGANLAEMVNLGLPVPPGFTITTEACRAYLVAGRDPDGLFEQVDEHLWTLEQKMGRRLGDPDEAVVERQQVVGPVDVVAHHVVAQALDEGLDGAGRHVGDGSGENSDEVGRQTRHDHLRAAQPRDAGVQVEQGGVRHPLGPTHVVRA